MFHTDPTFRSLLLALAATDPPDLGALGPLADWLEERDDGRADEVRALRVLEYNDGGIAFWHIAPAPLVTLSGWKGESHLTPGRAAEALIRRVLSLFPEGPRWEVKFHTLTGWESGGEFLRYADTTARILAQSPPMPFACQPPDAPSWPAPPVHEDRIRHDAYLLGLCAGSRAEAKAVRQVFGNP